MNLLCCKLFGKLSLFLLILSLVDVHDFKDLVDIGGVVVLELELFLLLLGNLLLAGDFVLNLLDVLELLPDLSHLLVDLSGEVVVVCELVCEDFLDSLLHSCFCVLENG